MRTQVSDGGGVAVDNTRLSLVIDLSEYYNAATLVIMCRSCGCLFQSDHEERWCARCVERREVLGIASSAPGR